MFLYVLIRLFDNHLNSLRTAKCLDIKGNHKGVAFEALSRRVFIYSRIYILWIWQHNLHNGKCLFRV